MFESREFQDRQPAALDPDEEALRAESTLKPEQWRAIEALTQGLRVVEAARLAGVHRNTVHRWLADEEFAGQLRVLGGAQRDLTQARIMALAETAVDRVGAAVSLGDARLALQLLKAMGVFRRDRVPAEHDMRALRVALDRLAEPAPPRRTQSNGQNADLGAGSDPLATPRQGRTRRDNVERQESRASDATDDPDRYWTEAWGNLAPDATPANPAAPTEAEAEAENSPANCSRLGAFFGCFVAAASIVMTRLAGGIQQSLATPRRSRQTATFCNMSAFSPRFSTFHRTLEATPFGPMLHRTLQAIRARSWPTTQLAAT